MVQSINAGAIDLASASEIPPIFAIESKASVKIIATLKGLTVGQVVLVPKNSTAKTIADLKGQQQRRQELLPVSDAAIASQQKVADTFFQAGVIPIKVDVKQLWDSSFNEDIAKCQ